MKKRGAAKERNVLLRQDINVVQVGQRQDFGVV